MTPAQWLRANPGKVWTDVRGWRHRYNSRRGRFEADAIGAWLWSPGPRRSVTFAATFSPPGKGVNGARVTRASQNDPGAGQSFELSPPGIFLASRRSFSRSACSPHSDSDKPIASACLATRSRSSEDE